MASTRDLWLESFSQNEIPAFPCPMCDRGNLRYTKNSLRLKEPNEYSIARQNGDISPLESVWRFSLFLKCVVEKCGNIVSVHGDATLQESKDWEYDADRYFHQLTPYGMHPAPPLATVPEETPDIVSKEMKTAFGLFWVDLGSCANRLRISVEKILDKLGAPAANTLHERIEAFKLTDPIHADTFDALRHVGNVGSHNGAVKREAVLDAFEIYQDALAELFGKRTDKISAMQQRLIRTKGRY